MLKKMITKIRCIYLQSIKWRHYDIGKNFHAGRGVFLWAKKNIKIGNNCYIGRYSCIECNTIIGDDVLIANNVALIGKYDHNYQQVGVSVRYAMNIRDKDYDWQEKDREIIVGNDVWIGYGSIILSGVNVAEGCIIAAGSVVIMDTEPYSIYGGVPAKRLADRFTSNDDKNRHIELLSRQG